MPAVVSQRSVIKEVRLNHPIHLQMLEMVCDALEEALPNICVVQGGSGLPVMHSIAALWPAAVCNARPIILIISVVDREFAVERMIDSKEVCPHVDLVVVV